MGETVREVPPGSGKVVLYLLKKYPFPQPNRGNGYVPWNKVLFYNRLLMSAMMRFANASADALSLLSA